MPVLLGFGVAPLLGRVSPVAAEIVLGVAIGAPLVLMLIAIGAGLARPSDLEHNQYGLAPLEVHQ